MVIDNYCCFVFIFHQESMLGTLWWLSLVVVLLPTQPTDLLHIPAATGDSSSRSLSQHAMLPTCLPSSVRREEIASCSEAAYESLRVQDAQRLLMLGSSAELEACAQAVRASRAERRWSGRGRLLPFHHGLVQCDLSHHH